MILVSCSQVLHNFLYRAYCLSEPVWNEQSLESNGGKGSGDRESINRQAGTSGLKTERNGKRRGGWGKEEQEERRRNWIHPATNQPWQERTPCLWKEWHPLIPRVHVAYSGEEPLSHTQIITHWCIKTHTLSGSIVSLLWDSVWVQQFLFQCLSSRHCNSSLQSSSVTVCLQKHSRKAPYTACLLSHSQWLTLWFNVKCEYWTQCTDFQECRFAWVCSQILASL